ncbi:hypothetical protein G9444_6415 [Rhodococcus erythropolis]|uniref:Uncharacterized protein n=1 Tax=Rhodococcus erythropolis TaxID=1833 RepID=A0A6G9D3B9_RHOER|nr:hypothetical protein [Rhodococcus erythropolis]QIP43658.1 hypothetical protein G9444_6415 [Rhodococcus erythropolis]
MTTNSRFLSDRLDRLSPLAHPVAGDVSDAKMSIPVPLAEAHENGVTAGLQVGVFRWGDEISVDRLVSVGEVNNDWRIVGQLCYLTPAMALQLAADLTAAAFHMIEDGQATK